MLGGRRLENGNRARLSFAVHKKIGIFSRWLETRHRLQADRLRHPGGRRRDAAVDRAVGHRDATGAGPLRRPATHGRRRQTVLMVGAWPHRPGTLRALMTILKSCHIVCRPCRRHSPLSAEREGLDRPYDPCPLVCSRCGARAEIVMEVPAGFALTPMAAEPPKPKPPEKEPSPLGPRHTPSF